MCADARVTFQSGRRRPSIVSHHAIAAVSRGPCLLGEHRVHADRHGDVELAARLDAMNRAASRPTSEAAAVQRHLLADHVARAAVLTLPERVA